MFENLRVRTNNNLRYLSIKVPIAMTAHGGAGLGFGDPIIIKTILVHRQFYN